MPPSIVHQCECDICQQTTPHPEQVLPQQMNLLLSRLDEQQRRWFAALESLRIGHGGVQRVSEITGLDPQTISRGPGIPGQATCESSSEPALSSLEQSADTLSLIFLDEHPASALRLVSVSLV